ncbi:MAG TPA: hypothetical protein VGH56_09570 [Solirubrobacteraceae bacterium]
MVTGDAELADSAPLADSEPLEVVWVELAREVEEAVSVLVGLVFVVVLELVLEVAGAEVFVVLSCGLVELVAPCEPPAAITAQASAKVERLAAATWRRVRAIRLARALRSRSPRVVEASRALEAALVFDMRAT